MTTGGRIKEWREKRKLTVAQLAQRVGLAQSTIYDLERGDSKSTTKLHRVAEALGVNPNWLETGKGRPDAIVKVGRDTVYVDANKATDKVFVRFIRGAQLSAGSGEVIWEFEEVENSHSFQRVWMQQRGLDPRRCMMWQVRGDSMWPEIPAGSVVLINAAEREPSNRGIFAIETDEGLRLKRLLRRVDGTWEIHSDNPDKNQYPSEPYVPNRVAIIGRMRWSAKEY